MKGYSKLVVMVAALIVFACNDTTKTKSGITINYVNKGTEALKDSSVVFLNIEFTSSQGKELFNYTNTGDAVPLTYQKAAWDTLGVFFEALAACKVGDSVTYELNAEELFLKSFNEEKLPDSVVAGSNVSFKVGVREQMTKQEFDDYRMKKFEEQQAILAAENEARIVEDGEAIDKYLAEKGIVAQTTESGLRYVIKEQGNGRKPQTGETVVAHYSGMLLDGTKFDSSYDRNQPFEFALGRGSVIPGWDKGFALMNVGTKATLYIPSPLAYGQRAIGPIPANSILMFDVELLDIK